MQTKGNITYSYHMKTDNLVDLIELFLEDKDVEPDSRLEEGQVFASDGTIVTL